MEIGVSTASFFLRMYNEEALPVLNELDARVVEVFLETFSEYSGEFGEKLKKYKGDLTVHSVLHLLGYDHTDEGEMKEQMRRREKEIMGDD